MTFVSDTPISRESPAEIRIAVAESLCTAETAECTCPDFCERDHDTD